MTGMAYFFFFKRTVCYEKADLYQLLLLNSGFFFSDAWGNERVWLSDDQMRELYQQKEAGYWHGVRENFRPVRSAAIIKQHNADMVWL